MQNPCGNPVDGWVYSLVSQLQWHTGWPFFFHKTTESLYIGLKCVSGHLLATTALLLRILRQSGHCTYIIYSSMIPRFLDSQKM